MYSFSVIHFQKLMRFQLLTVMSRKVAVFSDVAPCSLVEIDRRLRCVTHRPDFEGNKHVCNIGQFLSDYTA
jgi:hypothetical protein